MEQKEVERLFMTCEPVKGLAFLLNDSVEVTAGPHRGATGAVIALRTPAPDPSYVIKLSSGQDVELGQSELVGVGTAGALAELQRWYSAQCDGEWEHTHFCIKIDTIDNPGWTISIGLTDTQLADAPFEEINDLMAERDWIHCRVQQQRFEGVGGPHMLGRIIRTFLQWAEDVSRDTAQHSHKLRACPRHRFSLQKSSHIPGC